MDVDRGQTASPVATPMDTSPTDAAPTTPLTNGVNGTHTNGERPPTPPLHRTPTEPQPSMEDAEAHKAAGNKHFKAKEYEKAISEYSKGMSR